MRNYSKSFKRAAASLAAVCTLGTCCVAGSVAWAVDSGTTTEPSTANIDITKKDQTSITIHKYEAPELKDAKHDGRELKSADLVDKVGSSSVAKKQVKGVEFTIWRLKTYQTGPAATGGNTKTDEVIDLSKADGWSKINKVQYLKLSDPKANGTTVYTVDQLMNGDATAQPALTKQFNKYTGDATKDNTKGYCTVANTQTKDGAKCVTGEDGSVKLENLPMGLYYIEETDISKAQINVNQGDTSKQADWKKVSITKAVAPFLITTPLPNSDPDSQKTKPWLYDVHVYPKNDTNPELPTKTGDVNRNDLVGDTTVPKKNDAQQTKTVEGTHITWTIAIPLTAPGKDKKYTKIGFVDKLIDKLTLLKDAQQKPMVKAKIAIYKEETDKAGVKKFVPNTVDSGGKLVPDEVPLEQTKDYTLTEPKAGAPTAGNNNTLTFKLSDGSDVTSSARATGLKLAKAKYEEASGSKDVKKIAKLVVEIVTKVDDTSLNEIANVANTFVDDNKTGDGDGNNPCVPGDEDPTKNKPECQDKDIPNEIMHYGTLTVSKFFKAGEGQQHKNKKKNMPLNGAKFDLYEVTSKVSGSNNVAVDDNDIAKGTKFDAVDITKDVTTISRTAVTGTNLVAAATFNVKKITHKEPADETSKPATDEATTLETKEKTEGQNKVNGTDSVKLLVYKAPKDNPKSVATKKLYCLVETKAPAGYKLDSAPHCVQLQEDITPTADNAQQVADRVAANLVEVENFKATELDKILGNLPMTGARGLVILTLCGIIGVAGTFFYIVLKRRKEQEQE